MVPQNKPCLHVVCGSAEVLSATLGHSGVLCACRRWAPGAEVSYLRKVALWQEAGGGSCVAIAGVCTGLVQEEGGGVHKLVAFAGEGWIRRGWEGTPPRAVEHSTLNAGTTQRALQGWRAV